jgi:lysophospholipid acyltransferase (LPLAT)-like uncharacterized protein
MTFAKKIKTLLLKKLAKLLIESIVFSSRVTISGRENINELLNENLPLIYIFWHRHILFVIHQFKNSGARPLISLSSDGELVAAVAEEFGMKPIRGSSSKGGARAFLSMVRSVQKENAQVLITADGPKGPARQIKAGTVQLAVKTRATIIPISWAGTRVKILEKSWDRFLIPLPFGRIHFAYGPGQPAAGRRHACRKTRPARRIVAIVFEIYPPSGQTNQILHLRCRMI